MNKAAAILLLFCLSNTAWCGDPVGRVILSVGDVQVQRDGKMIQLPRNADVFPGDEIRTGQSANAQIRFTDAGIVALRPNTMFRVDEFAYGQRESGAEKAFFSLIKGGLRAITGAIGHERRQDYGIVTPTSTIGIRGTHFNLAVCADDCRNADGSLAANGTYGGVIQGRISSTPNDNPSASREFSRGEFFFAPSATSAPQPLAAPPSFLTAKLDTKQNAATSSSESSTTTGGDTDADTQASATDSSTESSTSGTSTTDGSLTESSTPTTTEDVTVLTTATSALPAVATETVSSSGTTAVINTVTGFIVQYFDGTNYVTLDSCDGTMCPTNSVSLFSNSGTVLTDYSNVNAPPKGSLAGGTAVDTGSALVNGAMFSWGRWTGNFLVTDTSGTTLSNLPSGVLFGMTDDTGVGGNQGNVWPTSGVVGYTLVGGPSPVDTAGNTGVMNSMTGTLDFLSRGITLDASLSMNVPTQGVANLTLSGSGTLTSTNDNLIDASITTSCTGGGCAAATSGGTFDARFAGNAAQVMVVNGIAINAVRNSSGTGAESVLFLDVLKCTSGC